MDHIVQSIMEVSTLALLLLLQFQSILVFSFEVQSKVCGPDLLAYSNFHGREAFYINGDLVAKNAFCKAVEVYHAKDCNFDGNYCGLNVDTFLDSSSLAQGRKLLQDVSSIDEVGRESPKEVQKTNDHTLVTPQSAGIVATGLVVMCCGLLCPCFYRKRKTTGHTVVSKDPHSVSSAEPISVPEKFTASPARVPPSPLRVPPSPSRFSNSPKLTRLGSVHLSMNQVARATHNFSQSHQIGEGGFGTVYKAQLEDGQVVAIKRAKKEHFEHLRTEFKSEVELLAKIDHRNLVKLLGYIEKGNDRIIITEYVPNGTLREHLDGHRGKILDFNQRLEISIDVAHALTYLHLYSEKQIIHRDVKSSNILLTESMRAKVADFGFARLGSVDSERTHVSTKVKGTVGYLDPEYMKTNQLTTKSDVYSFGILLIEILTGRRPLEPKRPSHERVTLRWAFNKYREGTVTETVDPLMEELVDKDTVMKMFALAIQCAAPTRLDRPDMKVVGEQLWAIRADYVKKSKERMVTV